MYLLKLKGLRMSFLKPTAKSVTDHFALPSDYRDSSCLKRIKSRDYDGQKATQTITKEAVCRWGGSPGQDAWRQRCSEPVR
jgi:hypothetical protein